MIQLRNLTIGYGRRRLLTDVNATITDGHLTALLGRNGSGKSTLLRAIAGLNRNYSGTIEIDGHDCHTLKSSTLAAHLAFVSTQRTRVANLRCRDVVAMGRAPYTDWLGRLKPRDTAIVDAAIESVGMTDYADRTMDRMSDGECQRIMIARALAQSTPVILLDEPTSFLDLPNRYELCGLLSDLAHHQGKCIIFSTHELDIALNVCDDIALIDTPRLHCLPADEMKRSGHIEKLFLSHRATYGTATGNI